MPFSISVSKDYQLSYINVELVTCYAAAMSLELLLGATLKKARQRFGHSLISVAQQLSPNTLFLVVGNGIATPSKSAVGAILKLAMKYKYISDHGQCPRDISYAIAKRLTAPCETAI